MNTAVNPLNRQLGLFGTKGTNILGKIKPGQGALGRGHSSWRSLAGRKTFGVPQKAWRGLGVGAFGLDAAMAPGQALSTAQNIQSAYGSPPNRSRALSRMSTVQRGSFGRQ